MKIAVDVRCLMDGRRTGVEEYLLNLLLNLLEIDKKNEYVLFYNSYKRPRFNFSIFRGYENVKIKRFRFPNKLLNLFFWYLNWPKIDKLVGGADVVFMPNIAFGAVSFVHVEERERQFGIRECAVRWAELAKNCEKANSG